MGITKTHLYFVPGFAAVKEIFKNISFPDDRYILHILEWIIPKIKDSPSDYAKKMAVNITEPDSVLVGVSFGGLLAQEMSVFLDLKKTHHYF